MRDKRRRPTGVKSCRVIDDVVVEVAGTVIKETVCSLEYGWWVLFAVRRSRLR